MHLRCPSGCKPKTTTPYYYAPSCFSIYYREEDKGLRLGVLADAEGDPTNMWQDGTVGIPAEIMELIRGGDDLPHCIDCQ